LFCFHGHDRARPQRREQAKTSVVGFVCAGFGCLFCIPKLATEVREQLMKRFRI